MQKIGEVLVPYGYEVWASGVYQRQSWFEGEQTPEPRIHAEAPAAYAKRLDRMCLSPLYISGIGQTTGATGTSEEVVCLSGISPQGAPFAEWVGRAFIADRRKLIALAEIGVPVSSENAGDLVTYLTQCEAVNRGALAPHTLASRTGFYQAGGAGSTATGDETFGWLLGRRYIGDGRVVADPREQGPFARGFVPSGNATAWLERWRDLRAAGAHARFVMGATFAAPLLRFVDVRSFMLYLWGGAQAGKSALAKFAISAWGSPRILMRSFNSTQLAPIEVFQHVTDVPVLFDERQAARKSFEFPQFIFAIGQEQGRARARRIGGLQGTYSFKTVVLCTGNQALVSESDLGGERARVLELFVGAEGARVVRGGSDLHVFVDRHHGWAGAEFLMRLHATLRSPEGTARLRARFDEITNSLISSLLPGVDLNAGAAAAATAETGESSVEAVEVALGSAARLVASIALGQYLAEWWLLGIDRDEALAQATADAQDMLAKVIEPGENFGERALRVLQEHLVGSSNLYLRDGVGWQERLDRIRGLVGIVSTSEGEVVYLPTEVNRVLRAAGLPPDRVWSEFAARGWLRRAGIDRGQQRVQTRRRVGGQVVRVYALRVDVLKGHEGGTGVTVPVDEELAPNVVPFPPRGRLVTENDRESF